MTPSPILFLGYRVQFRGETPEVVGGVTLITQDLLVRAVLAPTYPTGTVTALATRVVMAVITVRLLHALDHALLPTPILLPPTLSVLYAIYLSHKPDLNLLRCFFCRGTAETQQRPHEVTLK